MLTGPINLNNPGWNTPIDSYNVGNPMPMQQMQSQPAQPFVWGAGGARLTPEQILARQEMAQQKMQADFSPVGSAWEGAGRVVNNVIGALDQKRLDKAQQANQAESNALMQAVLGGGTDAVTQALVSPYSSPQVQQFAKMQWERQNPKPTAPHYWETNNGSLGVVGPDGKPQILYTDPTPKIDWIQAKDPATGQITLYPMQQGGGGPVSGALPGAIPPPPAGIPTAPVGKLTPIGGGAGNSASPFPR